MKKRIPTIFLLILILGGIAMSILNFSTPAYARAPLYGTTTKGGDMLSQGIWTLAGRYLGHWNNNNWYCCLDASNCCVVYGD